MSLWQSLFGTKTHCTGCGAVVPNVNPRPGEEVYCSEVCRANVVRLSTIPPARQASENDDERSRGANEPVRR